MDLWLENILREDEEDKEVDYDSTESNDQG